MKRAFQLINISGFFFFFFSIAEDQFGKLEGIQDELALSMSVPYGNSSATCLLALLDTYKCPLYVVGAGEHERDCDFNKRE